MEISKLESECVRVAAGWVYDGFNGDKARVEMVFHPATGRVFGVDVDRGRGLFALAGRTYQDVAEVRYYLENHRKVHFSQFHATQYAN